jgi:tetratricopeptide (TPR) repeat protein
MKRANFQIALIVITTFGIGNQLSAQTPDAKGKKSGVGISKDSVTVQEGGNGVEITNDGATKIDTKNPDFDRGTELLFANRMPQAIEFLGRSLKSDPTNPQAYTNLAEAYYHLDEYEKVIEHCNKAIELSKAGWLYRTRHSVKASPSDSLVKSDLASAYTKRGIAKWELKQKPAAVKDFDDAVSYGASDSTLYTYRGQYYLNEGKLDKAIEDFTSAIKVAPKLALPYGLRALAELKQGDDALAEADFSRADQIDPAVRKQLKSLADGIRASRK